MNTGKDNLEFGPGSVALDEVGITTKENPIDVNIKENFESEDTLCDILAQLKIMNLHLAILTDTHIRRTEVE